MSAPNTGIPDGGVLDVYCRVDTAGNGYGVALMAYDIKLIKIAGGRVSTLAEVDNNALHSDPDVQLSTTLHLECANDNDNPAVRIRLWRDGQDLLRAIDSTDPILPGGPLGLRTELSDG
jgi:hypothetical protein